jgi:hypothetical protein
MTKPNNQPKPAGKTMASYNRLFKSGFIEKGVYDNKVQKFSQQSQPPQPKKNPSEISCQKLPCHNNAKNIIPLQNKTSSQPIKNHTNSSFAAQIISRGPISNLSGQYPMNGAPGTSIR